MIERLEPVEQWFWVRDGLFGEWEYNENAVLLSGVLQRDVDVPLLNRAFPGYPVLAYFEFAPAVSDVSQRVVEDAVRLAGAGYRMEERELAEKTGYRLAADAGG